MQTDCKRKLQRLQKILRFIKPTTVLLEVY